MTITMRDPVIPLLLAALVSVPAAAYHWTDAAPFACPVNIDNQCDRIQEGGYRFENVTDSRLNVYGDNNFSGFVLSHDSIDAPGLGVTAKQQHCIVGALHNSPFMSAAHDRTFSVKSLHARATCEVPVQMVYQMMDGSECTESYLGDLNQSIIHNTQCGGMSCLPSAEPISLEAPLAAGLFDIATITSPLMRPLTSGVTQGQADSPFDRKQMSLRSVQSRFLPSSSTVTLQ